MAKNGALTIESLDTPSTVSPGEQFNGTMTLSMSANQVPEGDVDRCDNSTACNVQDGGNGYCVQPYVQTPVNGVIKHPGMCITAPSSGVKTVKLSFTVTAPNNQYNDSIFNVIGGFNLPGKSGEASAMDRNNQIAQDEVSNRVTIQGQTGQGGNTPPSINGLNIGYKTGAATGSVDAVDTDANITGYTWEWYLWGGSTFGGNISQGPDVRMNISGGNPSEARVDHPNAFPEGDFQFTYFMVRVTVHDAAGRTATTQRVIQSPPTDFLSNIKAPPGTINNVSTDIGGGGFQGHGGGLLGNKTALIGLGVVSAAAVGMSMSDDNNGNNKR